MHRTISRAACFWTALLFVLGVSVLDYLTGYSLRLWPFNLAAVTAAAWFCGLGESLFLAILAGLCNMPVELRALESGPVWHLVWNVCSRTAIMLTAGFVFQRLRTAMRAQEEAVARMTQAKTILERNQAVLDKSQSLAHLGSFEWDGESDAMVWSAEFYRLLDIDFAQWPGVSRMLSRFGENEADKLRGLLQTAKGPAGTARGDAGTKAGEGAGDKARILHFYIERLSMDGREILAGAAQDVTEQRRLEELRNQVERMIQHDLRSPLSSIVNIPRILVEEGNVTPRQAELLEAVAEAGENMLLMINLSLDIHRMERGVFVLEPFPVDLNALATRVARHQSALARARGVELAVLVEGRPAQEAGAVTVPANETLCYSMLSNLVRNALEAAPRGSRAVIGLRRGAGEVSLTVRNEGEIPLEIRDKLFEKYATAGKKSGLGLGAYSARLIARAHGGDVSAASSPETGVTMTVRLPLFRPSGEGKTA